MKRWWMVRVAKFFVIGIVAVLVFGSAVMLLWNWLVPDLFRGPAITFWQSIGLLVLSHILLRGGGHWRHARGWRSDRWKHRFEEKLAAMTPEEREAFKSEWRRRCGWEPKGPAETSKA
jgi:hypothetical protein